MHTVYTLYSMDTVYSEYMTDIQRLGTRDARAELGRLVDEAHFRGQHVILTKNEEPRAVLVPYEWWLAQQAQTESGLTPP